MEERFQREKKETNARVQKAEQRLLREKTEAEKAAAAKAKDPASSTERETNPATAIASATLSLAAAKLATLAASANEVAERKQEAIEAAAKRRAHRRTAKTAATQARAERNRAATERHEAAVAQRAAGLCWDPVWDAEGGERALLNVGDLVGYRPNKDAGVEESAWVAGKVVTDWKDGTFNILAGGQRWTAIPRQRI